MQLTQIDKGEDVSYRNTYDCLYINGERHRINALNYLQQGNLEYAIGSFRKMLRNYEAAQRFKDFEIAGLDQLTNRLAEEIAKQIMYGEYDK